MVIGIDVKEIVGEDSIKGLNTLMLKRNVIVHNSGIVDKAFISSSGLNINIGSKVDIFRNEIEEYIDLVRSFCMSC